MRVAKGDSERRSWKDPSSMSRQKVLKRCPESTSSRALRELWYVDIQTLPVASTIGTMTIQSENSIQSVVAL